MNVLEDAKWITIKKTFLYCLKRWLMRMVLH